MQEDIENLEEQGLKNGRKKKGRNKEIKEESTEYGETKKRRKEGRIKRFKRGRKKEKNMHRLFIYHHSILKFTDIYLWELVGFTRAPFTQPCLYSYEV